MLENMFSTRPTMPSPGPKIESVAGLRVSETSFDDERRTFVIVGSLEFGRIAEGLEVCLPLTDGQDLYVSVCTVDVVEDSAGITRLAVSVVVPFEGRERLERLNVVGEQVRLVRRTVETSSGETPNGEHVWQLVVAILSLLILVAAFFLPALELGGFSAKAIGWMAAAAGLFGGAVVLSRNSLQWAVLVLMGACVFFFASCTFNFQLHLD